MKKKINGEAKKRLGRPKTENPRTIKLSIRLTPDEHARVRARWDSDGIRERLLALDPPSEKTLRKVLEAARTT